MPGVHFTLEQKLSIARKLDAVGVHQIEAGFPAVSEAEKASVKEVASLGLDADVLCLSRALKQDIDAAIECDVDMVLLFIATSDLHLRYKLKMTQGAGPGQGYPGGRVRACPRPQGEHEFRGQHQVGCVVHGGDVQRVRAGRGRQTGHHRHPRLRRARGHPLHHIQDEGDCQAASVRAPAQRFRPRHRQFDIGAYCRCRSDCHDGGRHRGEGRQRVPGAVRDGPEAPVQAGYRDRDRRPDRT